MKKLRYKDFVKPGNKCIATIHGWSYGDEEHIVTLTDGKRYTPNGKETTRWHGWDDTQVLYYRWCGDGWNSPRYEQKRYEQVQLADLRPLRSVTECDEADLRYLFKKVSFGSMYYSDYNNNLDVDTHELMAVCEGYSDEVAEEHPDDWYDYLVEDDFVEYCRDYAA